MIWENVAVLRQRTLEMRRLETRMLKLLKDIEGADTLLDNDIDPVDKTRLVEQVDACWEPLKDQFNVVKNAYNSPQPIEE